MVKQTHFDPQPAHRYFAADCFNKTWDLIDKPQRTSQDEEQMLSLAFASLYHWGQRADCTPQNLSVGNWQVSRVFALLGQADNARRFAQRCLEYSQGEPPFYIAYAYEALARAEHLAGNHLKFTEYFNQALSITGTVPDLEARKMLENDLNSLR
ncbi:MAG: hypothetical protein JW726_05165 [Anaerolineales bacterium]|nr:hypothetical protein [Anaerolineales bacterium]